MCRQHAYFFRLRRSVAHVENIGPEAYRLRLGEFALQGLQHRLARKIGTAGWALLCAGPDLARLEAAFWKSWFRSVPAGDPRLSRPPVNKPARKPRSDACLPRGRPVWWEQRSRAWIADFQLYFATLLEEWLQSVALPGLEERRHRVAHGVAQPLATQVLRQSSETDLSILVLRLSGHPPGLLRFCLRECERSQQMMPPEFLEVVPRNWQAMRDWPLRSRRLQRLGIVVPAGEPSRSRRCASSSWRRASADRPGGACTGYH